ncbi:putative reverse transcriptase domain-containing protein [Tanacetum coccineum]
MLRVFPMSLTGVASRWLRNKPSGSIKTWEDLKTKFLSKCCPPARTTKKMEEINNFLQEPDKTLYQAWERFKELLIKCPQHYLTEMQEVILFYNWIRSTETSNGLEAIQAQLNNLGREIKKVNEKVYVAQVGCEQRKGPYYTKDFPLKEEDIDNSIPRKEKDPGSFTLPCYINNVFFDNALADLGASIGQYARGCESALDRWKIIFVAAHAKIDMFKRKITLRVREEKTIFKSVKPVSSLIKRVYMLSLKERMELDLEARLMEETLVINRSLDPSYGDYIE